LPEAFAYICSMQVDDALIDKLSRLSQLHFSGAERAEIKKDLEQMIGFVDKLGELDIKGVKPLLHLGDSVNVFREDQPGDMVSREEALLNAPAREGAFFTVPTPIKKTE